MQQQHDDSPSIQLDERSWNRKNTYYIILFVRHYGKGKTVGTVIRLVVSKCIRRRLTAKGRWGQWALESDENILDLVCGGDFTVFLAKLIKLYT